MSKEVKLQATELNSLGGVHCPPPNVPSWNSHPRVFIEVATHGQGRCHYCGTVYTLLDHTLSPQPH